MFISILKWIHFYKMYLIFILENICKSFKINNKLYYSKFNYSLIIFFFSKTLFFLYKFLKHFNKSIKKQDNIIKIIRNALMFKINSSDTKLLLQHHFEDFGTQVAHHFLRNPNY